MRKRYQVPAIASSEITSESAYLNRRSLIKATGLAALPALVGSTGVAAEETGGEALEYAPAAQDSGDGFFTSEPQTPLDDVKSYCNFYEFGMDKGDPAKHAHRLTTDPWSVKVDGLVDNPGNYDLADLISGRRNRNRLVSPDPCPPPASDASWENDPGLD